MTLKDNTSLLCLANDGYKSAGPTSLTKLDTNAVEKNDNTKNWVAKYDETTKRCYTVVKTSEKITVSTSFFRDFSTDSAD